MRNRRRRRALAALAVAVAGWLVLTTVAVVLPGADRPRRVDAIVVLGPADEQHRLATAVRLVRAGVASTLLISQPNDNREVARFCDAAHPGITVYCFDPKPATTRGEAEQVRRVGAQLGWRSIAVVTSTYHLTRARMIVRRCWSGRLAMVEATGSTSLGTWAYQYLYQSGAYLKALTQQGC